MTAVVLVPALTALVVYGLTMCRTVYFGDSAELSAAAAVLGIAHPPGYPLYLLLGRLAVAATPGEPALAMNMVSALAAAATAGCAAALAAFLGARPLAAISAGLLVIGSRMVWSQAAVAEVYTVHAALASGFLLALAADERRPRGDLRPLLVAVYLLGLGLAHHLSIVYVGLAGLVLIAARRPLPWRAVIPALVLGAIALSLYAVLSVRSRFDPPLDWGNPETAARLVDHVTARQYHFLVGKLRGLDVLRRLGQVCGELATDLHPVYLVVAVIGFLRLRRRPAWLAALLIVVVALIAHAVAYGITDIAGHLLPAAVVLAVASGIGLDSLAQFLERAAARTGERGGNPQALRTAAAAIVCAAALAPIALHWRDADLSKHRSAREFGENLLSSLPQGATLFAEGDNQVFILAYLKTTSGIRPDVTVIDGDGNLLDDFYGMRGEHGPPPAVDFRARRLEVESAELKRWFAADPQRPVFYSGRSNIAAVGPFIQETSGLLMRVRPKGAQVADSALAQSHPSHSLSPADLDPWTLIHTEAIRRDALRGDALTREVAARYWVRRGEAAFERGDSVSMGAAFDSALAVAPQNADLNSYLGAFHAQNGMLDRAIPLLERAVRQNPLSVRGWTNLGLALIKSGRKVEGMAALRESLRIQPDQEQVLATLRQLNRGGD